MILKRKIMLFSLLLLLILLPVLYLVIRYQPSIEAAWYDDTWAYRKAIAIPTHTAAENNAYVTVPTFDATDTTKFQSDCGDLRFTKQNGELLPYYVVDCDATATIHVLFDVLPAGASTYYMYYGNSSAPNGFNSADFSTAATNLGSQTLASEEKSAGPVAYWKFDEGYGAVAFDSMKVSDGTISGVTWKGEDLCISGKCLSYDGASDKVTVGNVSQLQIPNAITVMGWIKNTSLGNRRFWASQGDGGSNADTEWWMEWTASNTVAFSVWNSSSSQVDVSCSNTLDSSWHFVAGTYDKDAGSNNIKIYVDGKLCNSNTQTGTIQTAANKSVIIGTIGAWPTQTWTGFIDDFKIYSYARSAAQIKADFASKGGGTVKGASAALGVNSKNSDVFSNGLVGYWKMDESATPAIDSSGNGNSGTWAGNTAAIAGKYGNAGDFDGSGDYISIGTPSILNITGTVSVSAWVKTSITGVTYANSTLAGNYSQYFLSLSDYSSSTPRVTGFVNVSGVGWKYIKGNTAINDNTWHHVMMTYDNQYIRVYLDGILDASPYVATGNLTTPSTFMIGSYNGGNNTDATIDEVRIYNRALSPKEVRDLYNWAPGPVVYYDFNEHTGTSSLYDKSGNGYTATLTSMAENDWTPGKYGSALEFDGSTNQYARVSSGIPAQGQNITVGAWVFPTTISGASQDHNNFAYSSYYLALGTNKFNIYTPGTSSQGWHTSNGSISANQWQYLAFSYDGANMRMYINGVLDKTVAMTGNLTSVATLDIGRRPDSYANPYLMQGKVDEYKVYNYVRSSKQIVEDMNAGHPAGGSPVGSQVGYWKFDEGYGTIAHDSSFQQNTGTLVSSPTWVDGKLGKALNFDGTTNSYVDITDIPANMANFTLSAWIYNVSGGDARHSILQSFWEIVGNQICYWSYSFVNQYWRCSTSSVPYNTWTHIATTWDGSIIRHYINGALDWTDTTSTTGTNQIFYTIAGYAGRVFKGKIDELKIYNSTLTADEIKLEYNRGSAMVLGSISNTSGLSGGSVASNSASAAYCVPGSSDTCNPPIGEWKFEEHTGSTANDSSGNGNTCTLYNFSTWAPGKYGSGIKSTYGSSNYGDVNDTASLQLTNTGTLEAWIKPNSYPTGTTWGVVANKGNWFSGRNNYSIYYQGSDNTLLLEVGWSSARNVVTLTNTATPLNQWSHLTITWDGSYIYGYLNGVYQNKAAMSGNPSSSGYNFYIGSPSSSSSYNFVGIIDNVQIYNYTRTPAQVAYDYNRGAPVGHWKMDECQGGIVNDSSGNSNTGTITIGATGSQIAVGTCTTASTAWGNGATGKYNSSLNFDGTDDYVRVSDNSILDIANALSISAWIKISELGYHGIVGKAASIWSDVSFAARISGSGQVYSFVTSADGTNVDDLRTTITADTNWHHLVYWFNGSVKKIYVDGIERATVNWSGPLYTNNQDISIGSYAWSNGLSYAMKGQLDEVKIFNYALTPEQIKNQYNAGAVVQFAPITGSP